MRRACSPGRTGDVFHQGLRSQEGVSGGGERGVSVQHRFSEKREGGGIIVLLEKRRPGRAYTSCMIRSRRFLL